MVFAFYVKESSTLFSNEATNSENLLSLMIAHIFNNCYKALVWKALLHTLGFCSLTSAVSSLHLMDQQQMCDFDSCVCALALSIVVGFFLILVEYTKVWCLATNVTSTLAIKYGNFVVASQYVGNYAKMMQTYWIRCVCIISEAHSPFHITSSSLDSLRLLNNYIIFSCFDHCSQRCFELQYSQSFLMVGASATIHL